MGTVLFSTMSLIKEGSFMKRLTIIALLSALAVTVTAILFCTLPSDPSEDPHNADINLSFTELSPSVESGNTRRIRLDMEYPRHFETVRLWSTCSGFDTTVNVDSTGDGDTLLYFDPLFITAGSCTVFVSATYRDKSLKDKTGLILLYVNEAPLQLKFVKIPDAFSTHAARIDTLLFVTNMQASFTVESAPPLDSFHLHLLSSLPNDTARVVLDPAAADTFAVMMRATSGTNMHDSATVGVKVYRALTLSTTDAPQTVIIGTVDTLFFTVADTNRPDPVSIELVNEASLDQAIMRVLESAPESLLIVVSPSTEGHFELIIRISNGVVDETMRHLVSFTGSDAEFWNRPTVAVSSVEGKPVAVDLTQYLIRPVAQGASLSSTIGSITADTLWQWTPPWGCDSTYDVTIAGNKGVSEFTLQLAISVTPGDIAAPKIRLADPLFADTTIGSSQITVEVVITDAGAGVSKVTFTANAKTTDGILHDDSVYSGAITGLVANEKTEITIAAFDKSMKKNRSEKKLYLTYDTTLDDETGPQFTRLSGPKDGDRVTKANDTLVYSIADDSGVDSVWWTINGAASGILAGQSSDKYSLVYTLAKYGINHIVIHAMDRASKRNRDSVTVTVKYNTVLSAITTATPETNATEIAVEPTFSWTGGSDEDGDTVYYRVSYGTAQNNLTSKSSETKENSVTIATANKLTLNTTYYWMVTAYTKKPYADTMQSTISSFKTAGGVPVITTQLQPTVKVIEGTTLTLKIEADSTPTPTYKWYKNDTLLTGQTAAEFSKTNVTASDAGEYFVMVSNGIGSGVTSTKAVVTVRLKATITSDPVAATANEGGSVTFTVNAAGDAPLSYQWLKDGQVINGATDTIYNYTNAVTTDSGKNFACVVSNMFSKDTSAAAALRVIAEPVYSVSYDANNGSGSVPVDGKMYKSGEQLTVLANTGLSRYQYEFDGWRLNNEDNGTVYYAGNKITVSSANIVLYAKWKKETCVVNFDGQGATPTPASVTVDVSSAIGTLPTVSSRTGYEFSGWWTGRKGTGDSITTAYIISGPITAFAKWIIKDYDGNVYTDVTIGTQVWMAENLKVTRYNDGTTAPYYVYNDDSSNKDKYGLLYSWEVVDPANPKKIAPTGWHVPNDAEWSTLQNYLIVNGYNFDGSTSVNKIGKALASRTDWEYSAVVGNVGNTLSSNNASGFAGMPGGYYYMIGFPQTHFSEIGYHGYWWTSTESSPGQQYQKYYYLSYDSYEFATESMYKDNGYSVRLLRDY